MVKERKRAETGRAAVMVWVWRANTAAGRKIALREIHAIARIVVGVSIVIWWGLLRSDYVCRCSEWLLLALIAAGSFVRAFQDAIDCRQSC